MCLVDLSNVNIVYGNSAEDVGITGAFPGFIGVASLERYSTSLTTKASTTTIHWPRL